MENQNAQPTIIATDSTQTAGSNTSKAPPPNLDNPSKRKFKIILIAFFVIFFLTIGTATAVYTFKEVSRSNNNELEQTPSSKPLPNTEFEISPNPTTGLNTHTECVVAGCSGQFCLSKEDAEGFVSTCEYSEKYACYKTSECKIQNDGKCNWTMTQELTSCLNSAR